MFPINYLSGALLQSAQVQIQQASDKTKQIHEDQELAKNIGGPDDQVEHQVENSEELVMIHEETHESDQQRKKKQAKPRSDSDDPQPAEGLDLQA
jgi:hypothetical protein